MTWINCKDQLPLPEQLIIFSLHNGLTRLGILRLNEELSPIFKTCDDWNDQDLGIFKSDIYQLNEVEEWTLVKGGM